MRLAKKHGGATIGEHEWAEDGAVTEVPDELGRHLLAAAPDEWTEVPADALAPAVKRGPGRPPRSAVVSE